MFVSKKRFISLCNEATQLAVENVNLHIKIAKLQRQLNDFTENMNKIIGYKK